MTLSDRAPWQVSNFEGKITTYTYTPQDKIQSITAPGGIETDFNYDSLGRVHTEHPAAYSANSLKTYDYDSYGGLKKITYPDSTFDQYTCSAAGDVTEFIDRDNVKTTYGYNGRRMLTSVSKWQGATELKSKTDYDASGDVADTIDASNRRTDYDHDALGNLLTIKQGPAGAQITTLTNGYLADRVLLHTVTDAMNHAVTYSYDAAGHPTDVIDALNHDTQQSYDADGNPEVLTTPMGFQTSRKYTLTQWLNWSNDAENEIVEYYYDNDGRRTSLVNRLNQTFTWSYDDAARTTTEKTPLLKTTVTALNVRGLLASIQKPSDPAGSPSITFDNYDSEGRLKQRTDGIGITTFTYWPNGLPEDITDAGLTSHKAYDEVNRLAEYDDGEGNAIKYQYFPSGELKQITYPDNRIVSYDYDDFGRMYHVYDGSRTTKYTYDGAGRLTRIDRPNGTYRIQVFDAANRLTQIEEHASSGQIFFYENLTYDDDGRIVTQQLYPKVPAYTFPADALTYDTDNRLLTWNSQSTVFDDNGNMTSGPLPSGSMGAYTYDVRNRLTSAAGSSYVYNPDGFRVQITGAGAATFVVDPNSALPRVLTRVKNGVTTDYVYGLGLLYEETGGSAKQYHFDHIGNTMALTDDSGGVTDRWTYSSFGTVTSRSGSTDTPFQFNGALGIQTDPDGLCYMRARYYNPRLMRFVNADPIKFGGGLNWYEYSSDSPLIRSDPSGQFDGDVSGSPDWYAPPGGWPKPNGAPDPVGNVIMGTFTAAVTSPVWVPVVVVGVVNAPEIAAASGRFATQAAANPAVQRATLVGTAIMSGALEYTETKGGDPAVEATAETVEKLGVENATAITKLSGYLGKVGGKLQEALESLFGESATNTSPPSTGGRTSDGGRS